MHKNVNIKEIIQKKMSIKSKKKNKSISIPKLDFSMIYDYYQNYQNNQIKEKQKKNLEVNDKQEDLFENIKKNHHHHHHHHHHNFQNIKFQL